MFRYDDVEFWYEPFPFGMISGLFEPGLLEALTGSFPPIEHFVYHPNHGKKYTFSELNNARLYHDYVRATPPWREFHRWIKSDDFIFGVFDLLKEHEIDLSIRRARQSRASRWLGLAQSALKGQIPTTREPLSSRFEFSQLPVDGGAVLPHTDSPSKIVSFVIPLVHEGEWDDSWGGGFEVMRAKDPKRNYNFKNAALDFDEVEVLRVVDFRPNTAALFVKTFNSYHGVNPMRGTGKPDFRRTVTVAIERGQ